MSKQFLMLCDELGMAKINSVCNGTVQFLEVVALTIEGQPALVLATPIPPIPEPVEQEAHD